MVHNNAGLVFVVAVVVCLFVLRGFLLVLVYECSRSCLKACFFFLSFFLSSSSFFLFVFVFVLSQCLG